MKKINLNQLSMSWNEKQSPQRFARYAAMLIMLLTLGVGQMWAEAFWPYAGFYEVYMTYSYSGNNTNYTFYSSDNNSSQSQALGTLTADFKVTALYFKCYKNSNDWSKSGNLCGGLMIYNTGSGDTEYQPTWTWTDKNTWHDTYQAHMWEISKTSCNKVIASYNSGASGSYTAKLAFKMWGSDDNGSDCGDNWWISNNSNNYKFTYKIAPPAISSFSVSKSGYISGAGTSGDPYIIPYNGTLTLTVSGSKGRTDGNSTIKYWKNSGDKQNSNVLTVTGITSSDLQSVVVHAQCINNSDASLVGTESNTTIYYKAGYAITPVAKYTTDGSTYTTGTTGGTVTINGSSSAIGVVKDATYSIVATPASGYCVEEIKVGETVAWEQANDNNRQTTAKTISTYTATADKTVTVKFARIQNITLHIHDGGVGGLVLQNATPKVGAHTVSLPNTTLTSEGNGWYYHIFDNVTSVTVLNVACSNTGAAAVANGGQPISTYTLSQTEYFSAIHSQNDGSSSICNVLGVSYTNQSYSIGSPAITLNPTYTLAPSGSPTYSWSVTSQPEGGAYSLSATNVASPTFSSTVEGTYTLRVQVTTGGCTKSTSFDVEVANGVPDPEISGATFVTNPILSNAHLQISVTYANIPAEGCYIRLKHGDGYWNDENNSPWTALSSGSGSMTFTTNNTNVSTGTWTIELYNNAKNSLLSSTNVTGSLSVLTAQTITISAGANGSVSPTTVYAGSGYRSESFTATPNDHYHFVNWSNNNSSNVTVNDVNSATTYVSTASAAATITANFAGDQYSITYKDQGDVAFSGNHVDSPSAHPTTHTYGTATSLNSATKTGYTFGGWFTTSACTGVAVNSLGATAYTANITLYAKWIENMTDVTLAASPAGGGTFTIGGAAATETTAGRTTTRSVTAVPGNGYYLTGTIWSKSNNNITLSSTTTNPTTVTGCGTVSTSSTLTATFKPIWYLKGAFNSWGTTHPFVFTSATSGYVDVELDGNSTFKLYDEQNDQWYGSQYGIEKGVRLSTELWSDNGNDCPITINGLAGTYRFTLDISSGKVVTVTPPTFNQIRFYSARVDGDLTNTYNFENTGSSPWTKSVNLTAGTTYWFKVIEDGTYLGNDGTMTRANCTNWTMSDANNCGITADVTGSYTFSYVPSTDKLTVTYPAAYTVTYGVGTNYTSMGSVSTSPSVTSGNYVIAGTSITFTATPNLGYKFIGWYSTAACTGVAVSTDASYNIASLAANTTLYAKFDYRPIYIHADFAPNGWDTPVLMTQSTANRAIYTYTTTLNALASAQVGGDWNTGYHFHFVNTVENPNANKAYTYDGVQTPTSSGCVDAIHKTADANPTIEFGLTNKAFVTITLTLKSIDDATKPTVSIAADQYYTVTTAKAGTGTAGVTVSPASVEARSGGVSAAVTAAVNTGYTFVNWTATSGITITTPNATSTTVRATAAGTLTANVNVNTYTVTLNAGGGTGSGSMTVNYDATAYATWSHTIARTGYTINGWYDDSDVKVLNANGSFAATNVTGYITSDKWSLDGNCTLYAHWTPNNYTVDFDVNGGTASTPDDKDVTFGSAYGSLPGGMTHTSKTFVGWYTDPDDGEGDLITAETIVSTASDHTLYAHYENVYSVNVTFKSGSATIYPATSVNASPTSLAPTITAPEIFGYTFTGWTGSSVTFGDASSATTTVNATAATTVTANYNVVPTVYFKNNLGWDSVFVSFNCSFVEGKDYAPSNNGKPYYAMKQIGSTDIYYCEIPDTYTSSDYAGWAWNIAFDNTNYGKTAATTHTGTWSEFYGGECVGRGDFDPKTTLYIPYNGDTETRNTCKFYKSGCWLKYNSTESGYQVNMNTWVNGEHADTLCVALEAANAGGYEFSAKLNLTHADYSYGFKLYKIYQKNTTDLWYTNTGTITAETEDLPWDFQSGSSVTANSQRCALHTEALGDYTITVSFATGKPMVDVEYPASVGDWRLAYNDLIAWSESGVAHDASWYLYSRVVKAKANAEDLVSFYVSKVVGANAHVELQKCTAISAGGVETWTKQGSNLDLSSITGTGIYNFKITQNGSKVATAAYDGPYSGDFYIRTDASDGGWNNYIASGKNIMTYSEYAKENSGFTHYFMRFVRTGSNIKFCIANDYSERLTEYCVSDDYTNEWIEADGNVRFMWDHRTNEVSRAYISGSSIVSDRFLVLEGSDKMYNESGLDLTTAGGGKVAGLNDYEMNFRDDQNWIYEATIKAKPGAKALLTAKYNNKIQYFGGSGPAVTDSVTLLGGSDTNKYKIRVVYDFKTNRLIKAFIPDGDIGTTLAIDADLMIIREHQGNAQQVTFTGDGKLTDVKTVYGAMKFNKYTVNGKEKEGGHAATGDSRYKRDLFYISFPFDVKLSEAFGFGTYGKHWIIEYYDGKSRAANGFWKDSESNWKFVWPSQRHNFTMKAFEGYILALDLDEMTESSDVWNNGVEDVYVYFPSDGYVSNISATNRLIEIDQDGYECTINRPTPDGDRRVKDSYWHCIGVPSFANYSSELSPTEGGTTIDWRSTSMPYLYEVDWENNDLNVTSSATFDFKATWSYMVQYAGESIYWSQVNVTPAAAPNRNPDAPQDTEYRLELRQNDQKVDQTFVRLSDDENVTTGFDFNYDLSKEFNKNKANIYTMVTTIMDDGPSVTQTAGNVLPMSEQTTVVPVGIKIASTGDYTFAIPEGTNGVGVTLIDNETGIRTSLSALDYTINLPAGTYDNRFVLEISPIVQSPTGIESAEHRTQNTDVHKVLIDNILYIVKDGVMYDDRGARVQ